MRVTVQAVPRQYCGQLVSPSQCTSKYCEPGQRHPAPQACSRRYTLHFLLPSQAQWVVAMTQRACVLGIHIVSGAVVRTSRKLELSMVSILVVLPGHPGCYLPDEVGFLSAGHCRDGHPN